MNKISVSNGSFCFPGAFPVVCMMIAQVVNREVSKSNDLQATYNSTANPTSLESVWSPYEAKKLEIAVTLALIIGFIQVVHIFTISIINCKNVVLILVIQWERN